jgi:cellulose synthase/poly-beta-1,6-N-acetylglucosamine synthase-like glycosyltransferase
VTLDGDTVFEPNTVSTLARHFADPRIGVVAGQVKVGNRRNIRTAWQSLEYISGVCLTRMAEGLLGAITIAPGACAAWRRSVVLEAGGYSSRTSCRTRSCRSPSRWSSCR